ncbi:MAG TPA: DoxX family membrane protein [Chitinophagaceae bacterium]|nr:DoxX family membrane protein [Chitinophagaceae bacterium]
MKNESHVYISTRSLTVLRCSIGIIYIWFGMLKFFHGYSPAEDLAINTIHRLTAGFIPAHTSIILLAVWETLLGVLLLLGFQSRKVLLFLLLHMVCTFTPLLFFPELSFKFAPYGFTLVGQYIMKNIIIVSAAGYYGKMFRPKD